MPRRGDHSREEFHAMVVLAAEAIVAESGVAGLSARAIAQRIGYSAGSIYLAFDGLDDVILHLNARTLDALHADIAKATRGKAKPLTRVKRAARAYAEFARQYPNRWRLPFEHQLPAGKQGPDWIQHRIQRLIELVIEPLAEEIGTRDESLEMAAQALWSGVHGICILTLTNKLHLVGRQRTEQLIDSLVTHYIAGVRAA